MTLLKFHIQGICYYFHISQDSGPNKVGLPAAHAILPFKVDESNCIIHVLRYENTSFSILIFS